MKNQPELLIAACYRPIVSDKTTIPSLQMTIDNINNRNNRNLIISGDFNFPGFDWSKKEIKPGCPYPPFMKNLKYFLPTMDLHK